MQYCVQGHYQLSVNNSTNDIHYQSPTASKDTSHRKHSLQIENKSISAPLLPISNVHPLQKGSSQHHLNRQWNLATEKCSVKTLPKSFPKTLARGGPKSSNTKVAQCVSDPPLHSLYRIPLKSYNLPQCYKSSASTSIMSQKRSDSQSRRAASHSRRADVVSEPSSSIHQRSCLTSPTYPDNDREQAQMADLPSRSSLRSHFLFWRKRQSQLPPGIIGFYNLGNTCYMNSAFQCLLATRLLSEYFYRKMHLPEIKKMKKDVASRGALALAFGELIQKYRTTTHPTTQMGMNLTPMKLLIERFHPLFRGFEQHDAQEFLALFLDGIHEELNRAYHKIDVCEPDINRRLYEQSNQERLAAASWQRYLYSNKSFFVDLFQGQLESRITCLNCHEISLKFEPFMYLSLPLTTTFFNRGVLLEDQLKAYSNSERILDAYWDCPNCKKKVSVEKRIKLVKLPPVFIIHFKRFQFTSQSFRKIETRIISPLTELNMQQFVKQKETPVFDLYGVIDHSGHAECGHYTAACNWDGRWFRFDDTNVYEIEAKQVISETNYVLFYQRRDVPIDPYLLRRQTLRHPEDWPHSLRSKSIEEIKKTMPQQQLGPCTSTDSTGPNIL